MLASITDTQGIIAIAAAAVAAIALLSCAALSISVRRLRAAQRTVLGDQGSRDLVAHAASVQEAFELLHESVGASAARLDARLADVEASLRGALAHHALVRYDAYNEHSGQQSMSIALLDSDQTGVVLTCIHHRDQARVYGKQVHAGRGELELSPEEEEAVHRALGGASRVPAGDERLA